MLAELDYPDWAEVFGEGGGGNCTPIVPDTPPNDTTNRDTFSREDVLLLEGKSEGERDERSWICWGQLKDGRWFFAEGHCDYTGWDCQASNGGSVASSRAEIIRFGMTDGERERLGLSL